MDRLNLTALKIDTSFTRCLSMDDYVKFVTLNLRYTVDKKAVREQKRQTAVNVRFSI